MSFIELKNGEIEVTEEGKTLPEIKELYAADRTSSHKRWYKDALTFLYYVYKRDGIYANLFPSERKERVIQRYMPGRSIKDFENNKAFVKVRDLYMDLQFTTVERMILKVDDDMEMLLKKISEVPLTKRVKVKIKIDDDGRTEERFIDMDNSEEKFKVMQIAEKLIEYQAKLREKIVRDERKKKTHKRLFDN
jgi:hypothetical protein